MKPANKAQGKGIFLFRNLNDVSDWKTGSRWYFIDNKIFNNKLNIFNYIGIQKHQKLNNMLYKNILTIHYYLEVLSK